MAITGDTHDTHDTHDTMAPALAGDPSSFPSHAECVRTLLGAGGFASLATVTADGYPYASLVAYSVLPDASVLMCLSDMAEHTQNARRVRRAGLLVNAPSDGGRDPLDEPRASILGDLAPHGATADEIAHHLSVHPLTSAYMDFSDFCWWRLAIVSARFVGGFGSMSWVSGDEIADAVVDEVLRGSGPAVDHMNADHADANLDMARHLGGVTAATSATLHAIDRHGLTLYAHVEGVPHTVRLRFPDGPLTSLAELRPAVVDLAHRARRASPDEAS
jgi:putative heme iron utilization protein